MLDEGSEVCHCYGILFGILPVRIRITFMSESRYKHLHFCLIQTRWNDNDLYGHDDKVIYYFDTAVNLYLIEEDGLDPHADDVIGVCPKTCCNLYSAVTYSEHLETRLWVARPRN